MPAHNTNHTFTFAQIIEAFREYFGGSEIDNALAQLLIDDGYTEIASAEELGDQLSSTFNSGVGTVFVSWEEPEEDEDEEEDDDEEASAADQKNDEARDKI